MRTRALIRGIASVGSVYAVISIPSGGAHGEEYPPDGEVAPAAGIVVKIDDDDGVSIEDVNEEYRTETLETVLASRGIYLVTPVDPARRSDKDITDLARRIDDHGPVDYAEPNIVAELNDYDRFHAWPSGEPFDAGTDVDVFRRQSASTQLDLGEVHAGVTGAGSVVAVLDTGADASHPALAGEMLAGWDYVDDDAEPDDTGDGVDQDGDGRADDALGHGTFVSGIVSLVAPDATVMPLRVLDDEGRGNFFVVAEAIIDSTDAGADVINLSFGTNKKLRSKLLEEAIKYAHKHDVAVIAAAGNDMTDDKRYPAAYTDVLAVSAIADDADALADFSNSGDWVAVAAPGESIVGPHPGGGYVWWSGTSVAAPFVSGQAALMRHKVPKIKADKIAKTIEHETRKLTDEDGKHAPDAIDLLASLHDLH